MCKGVWGGWREIRVTFSYLLSIMANHIPSKQKHTFPYLLSIMENHIPSKQKHTFPKKRFEELELYTYSQIKGLIWSFDDIITMIHDRESGYKDYKHNMKHIVGSLHRCIAYSQCKIKNIESNILRLKILCLLLFFCVSLLLIYNP